jgi:hypothetical protein
VARESRRSDARQSYPNAYPNHFNFWPIRRCPPMSPNRVDLHEPNSGERQQTPFGYLGVQVVAGSNPVSPTQVRGYFLSFYTWAIPKRNTQTILSQASTSKLAHESA